MLTSHFECSEPPAAGGYLQDSRDLEQRCSRVSKVRVSQESGSREARKKQTTSHRKAKSKVRETSKLQASG